MKDHFLIIFPKHRELELILRHTDIVENCLFGRKNVDGRWKSKHSQRSVFYLQNQMISLLRGSHLPGMDVLHSSGATYLQNSGPPNLNGVDLLGLETLQEEVCADVN